MFDMSVRVYDGGVFKEMMCCVSDRKACLGSLHTEEQANTLQWSRYATGTLVVCV